MYQTCWMAEPQKKFFVGWNKFPKRDSEISIAKSSQRVFHLIRLAQMNLKGKIQFKIGNQEFSQSFSKAFALIIRSNSI